MRYFVFSDFVQPFFFGGKYNFSSSVNIQKQIISTTFAQYYLAFSTENIIGALSLFAIVMLYFPKPHDIYN